MTEQKNLLNKYYKGETSLKEEKELRLLMFEDPSASERDIFEFYENENKIPGDIDKILLTGLETIQNKGKSIRLIILQAISAVAVVLIAVSIFFDIRYKRNSQIENDFFVMEQALSKVSESLQPVEQEDMMVLWVDDNVEIIIN